MTLKQLYDKIQKDPLKIKVLEINDLKMRPFPTVLFQCKNLRKLTIKNTNLKEIPKEITQLQNLEYLDLKQNDIQNLPKEVGALKKLKVLIANSNKIETIAKEIFEISSLEELLLRNNKLVEIPEFKVKETNLKKLTLSNNKIKTLAHSIGDCVELNDLHLNKNKIQALPESFNTLKNVSILSLMFNSIKVFPECFKTMPKVKHINVNQNHIKELPLWLKDKTTLESLSFGNIKLQSFPEVLLHLDKKVEISGLYHIYDLPENMSLASFIRKIRTSNMSIEEQLAQIYLYAGDIKATRKLSRSILIKSIKLTRSVSIKANAITSILDKSKKQKLQEGSEIWLLGKLKATNLRQVKKQVKEAGITLVTTPTNQTTHILVSTSIQGKYDEKYDKLPCIETLTLLNYLEECFPPFILENKAEVPQNIDNILQLLNSPEEASQLLGLEMLESGGLPRTLLTDVFFVFQSTEDEEVKKKSRALLKRYGSTELKGKLRYKSLIEHYNRYLTEETFKKHFKKLVEGTELDALKFIRLSYLRFGVGREMLLELKKEEDPKALLALITKNKTLDLSIIEAEPLLPYLDETLEGLNLYYADLTTFPKEVLKLKKLKSLDLSRNKFDIIPNEIEQLSQLEKLSLERLSLTELPPLKKLTNLKSLAIGYIDIIQDENINKVLEDKPNLKELHLQGLLHLTIVPPILRTCKKLKYLNLRRCGNISNLPDWLEELTHLEAIILNETSIEEIPEVLTKLPNLQLIKANFSLLDELRARTNEFPQGCQFNW